MAERFVFLYIRIHILEYKSVWTFQLLDTPYYILYTIALGGLSETVRPDPIPNSVVKRLSGDDNTLARVRENTSLPDLNKALPKGELFLFR